MVMISKKGFGWGTIAAAVFFIVVFIVAIKFVLKIRDSASGVEEIVGLSPEEIMNDAEEAYKNEYYEEAIRLYNDFLLKFPKHKDAYKAQFRIGDCYFAMEDYHKALISYKNTKENYDLDPNIQAEVEAKIQQTESLLSY